MGADGEAASANGARRFTAPSVAPLRSVAAGFGGCSTVGGGGSGVFVAGGGGDDESIAPTAGGDAADALAHRRMSTCA